MNKNPELNTWSAKQAVAILSVDNIQLSNFGYITLKKYEEGLITYEEAKEQILQNARNKIISISK